jgi:hypothetical protein
MIEPVQQPESRDDESNGAKHALATNNSAQRPLPGSAAFVVRHPFEALVTWYDACTFQVSDHLLADLLEFQV